MYPTKLLIVVDMQKDFVDPDGKLTLYSEAKTEKLVDGIADYIKNFNERVFYTLDTHENSSCEFSSFPAHCIEGTEGHKLTDKIATAILEKERSNQRTISGLGKASYTGSKLVDFLATTYPDMEYHIVGVCTHICVHDITSSLVNRFKELHNKVPKVIIPKELTGDFDLEMAEFALKRLERLYGVEVA